MRSTSVWRSLWSNSPRRSSVATRREVLTAIGTQWPGIRLPTVCCFCLSRPIEHMLPCRHAVCDTCVTIFGSPSRSAEYHVDLSRCPWCQETCDLTVHQLPPTKGAVVVALDGGGIRGLVTLGLLRALEGRLEGAMTIAQIANYISVPAWVGAINDVVKSSRSWFPCSPLRDGNADELQAPSSPLTSCITGHPSKMGISSSQTSREKSSGRVCMVP